MFKRLIAFAISFWGGLIEFGVYCVNGPSNLLGILVFKLTGDPSHLNHHQLFFQLGECISTDPKKVELHKVLWAEARRRDTMVDPKGLDIVYYGR